MLGIILSIANMCQPTETITALAQSVVKELRFPVLVASLFGITPESIPFFFSHPVPRHRTLLPDLYWEERGDGVRENVSNDNDSCNGSGVANNRLIQKIKELTKALRIEISKNDAFKINMTAADELLKGQIALLYEERMKARSYKIQYDAVVKHGGMNTDADQKMYRQHQKIVALAVKQQQQHLEEVWHPLAQSTEALVSEKIEVYEDENRLRRERFYRREFSCTHVQSKLPQTINVKKGNNAAVDRNPFKDDDDDDDDDYRQDDNIEGEVNKKDYKILEEIRDGDDGPNCVVNSKDNTNNTVSLERLFAISSGPVGYHRNQHQRHHLSVTNMMPPTSVTHKIVLGANCS